MNTAHNKKAVTLLSGLGGMVLAMSSAGAVAGTITGSAHDLSSKSYTQGQICITCHVPHGGQVSSIGPLWNHELTTASHTPYSSGTLNATIGAIGGASKLCLSCHDGTVAVDSFGGATGGENISAFGAGRNLGTDLSNDHPFSFDYTAIDSGSGAGADDGIKTAESTNVTIGSTTGTNAKSKSGTIAEVMLASDGTMQCTSCHDVHNEYTATSKDSTGTDTEGYRLLKVSLNGSTLCLTCHDK